MHWRWKILSRLLSPSCYHIYGPYGWCRFNQTNQTQIPPPPPYQQPPSYALHAPVPQSAYGMVHPNQCPIHRMQQCTCLHMANNEVSDCLPLSVSLSVYINAAILWQALLLDSVHWLFAHLITSHLIPAEHVASLRDGNVAVVSAQRAESRPDG